MVAIALAGIVSLNRGTGKWLPWLVALAVAAVTVAEIGGLCFRDLYSVLIWLLLLTRLLLLGGCGAHDDDNPTTTFRVGDENDGNDFCESSGLTFEGLSEVR